MMEQEAQDQAARPGVGIVLKAAREQAGMSLGEVAERLKLSIRQLEAIEKDDFQQLPGATFVRGFVRNYARFLKVDPEPLMQQLEQHFPSAVNDVVNLVKHEAHTESSSSMADTLARVPAPPAAARKTGKWLLLLLLAAVVGAVVLWFGGRQGRATQAEAPGLQPMLTQQALSAPVASAAQAASAALAAPDSPAVVASQPQAAPAPVPSKPLASAASSISKPAASAPVSSEAAGHIQLTASQAAWVSVIDATGKKLQFGTLEAGSSKEISGMPPFQLKIGNAAQVKLNFNGQAVDLTDKIRGTTAKIELK
ncbi:MAG: DUF4115 domain-containing protein [Aquitalea sp.]|nr:DUF4115 domain-containing protein [Aquitalea sp.]